MFSIPVPSPASLAHRARISSLMAELRPGRYNMKVLQLPAHRIPTLWTLYRGLLRDAPSENIRWRISVLFRENRHLLRYGETIRALRKAQRWRDIFVRAKEGDEHMQTVLQRYDKMIEAKRDKEKFKMMLIEAIEWREKMKRRAILTGAYHRPTLYNRPLPRMKPQPVHVTGMILKRRRARTKRQLRYVDLSEWREDLRLEQTFEKNLIHKAARDGVQVDPVFSDAPKEWEEFINKQMYDIRQTFERDAARATTPYSPEMLEMIKAARREKIANKTRERERERRGQVFRKTLKRQRQGPPAHVLAIMTERQKHMDKVSRGVSEVGYVGQVKRALGFKLRNPDAWKAEIGRLEDKERLDKMMFEIMAENERRRALSEAKLVSET